MRFICFCADCVILTHVAEFSTKYAVLYVCFMNFDLLLKKTWAGPACAGAGGQEWNGGAGLGWGLGLRKWLGVVAWAGVGV
jgi:hypothetical protein